MLRCIAFSSAPIGNWSEGQIDDLQNSIAEQNGRRSVTGFLLVQDGRIFQVLEGFDSTIENVFGKISTDTRHGNIVKLLDRLIDKRAFVKWTVGRPDTLSMTRHVHRSLAVDLARSDAHLIKPQLDTQPLLDLMGGSVGRMLSGLLRVKPVQTRAIETIDRLISAAETIIIRRGVEEITVEAVAEEAMLTHQATYRYFKNSGDIFRIVMKKRQALGFKKIIEAIKTDNFDSPTDIANFVASFSFKSYLQDGFVPRKTKMYMIKNYHDIAFDEILKLAEAIYDMMKRCKILYKDVGVVEIAAGLAAMAGTLKLVVIQDGALVDQSRIHPILVRVFLGALDTRTLDGM